MPKPKKQSKAAKKWENAKNPTRALSSATCVISSWPRDIDTESTYCPTESDTSEQSDGEEEDFTHPSIDPTELINPKLAEAAVWEDEVEILEELEQEIEKRESRRETSQTLWPIFGKLPVKVCSIAHSQWLADKSTETDTASN
jgi:hypothetical protein